MSKPSHLPLDALPAVAAAVFAVAAAPTLRTELSATVLLPR